MSKKKKKSNDKPKPDAGFTISWADLINPADKVNINPDTIDQMEPYNWDSDQVSK